MAQLFGNTVLSFALLGSTLFSIVFTIPLESDTATATTPGNAVTPAHTNVCKNSTDGELVPDPTNKNGFYECTNHGSAFRFLCPNNLVFDPVKKVCIFDRTAPTQKPVYNGTSKFDCAGKKDGFYGDAKNARLFHECTNGYPADFECPPSTVFDSTRNVCAFDTNPTTANPATINPTTANPATINPTTENSATNPTTASPATTNPTTANPATINPTTVVVTTTQVNQQTTRGRHNWFMWWK